jgi:hypothetical protein
MRIGFSHRYPSYFRPEGIYTKPREKSGGVSLVPEDIHDRQLYILDKIRTNRDINEPMDQRNIVNTKTYENLTSLGPLTKTTTLRQ